LKENTMNEATSKNTVKVTGEEGGRMDFDFSALDFPTWQEMFKGLKPGDRVRVRVVLEKE
jgi:hypothetical protein